MYQQQPFTSIAATSLIAANSTAPAGVQLAGDPTNETLGFRQYRAVNPSNMTVFFACGANATVAQNNAVIPTNASVGGNSHPLPAGGTVIVTAKVGQYWSAITAANFAGQGFYITPGLGIS